MSTQKRLSAMCAVMTLALLGIVSSALAQVEPQAGTWKTHILTSGSALRILVSIAHYDTIVACWGTRYVYWYARPVHLDPAITPTFTTPPQPAYPSGHSCIEGATSQTLAYLFPREAAVFQSGAEELAKSRWWARIHFTWDNNDGLRLGRGVADKVIAWAKADGAP